MSVKLKMEMLNAIGIGIAMQYHLAQVPLGSNPWLVQTNYYRKQKIHNLYSLLKTAAVLLWPFLLLCPVTLQWSVSIFFLNICALTWWRYKYCHALSRPAVPGELLSICTRGFSSIKLVVQREFGSPHPLHDYTINIDHAEPLNVVIE